MLDFNQIKNQYSEELQVYERAILREYLQYKILQALFESKKAKRLAFLGGTALRIVYGNRRFSEDIDLDNFDLSWGEFEELVEEVGRFLELEGFEVELRKVSRQAFRCYIKFPDLLYEQGISPHQEEKILIQVDTVAQGYDYQPELKILNKFDVFAQIRVSPEELILASKIYTAVNGKRAKGRDFYDISVLLGRCKPQMRFLQERLKVPASKVKEKISEEIEEFDFEELAGDVEPFLIDKRQVDRVVNFKEFWQQVELV